MNYQSVEKLQSKFKLDKGWEVLDAGYKGEVIRVSGENVLIHFGGDSLHCTQEWCNIEDIKLEK